MALIASSHGNYVFLHRFDVYVVVEMDNVFALSFSYVDLHIDTHHALSALRLLRVLVDNVIELDL
jgi:hypothetical protein